MNQNVGIPDRAIRMIAGILGIWLAIYYSLWWWILATVGLFTAITGWCHLYTILRVNTCNLDRMRE